MSKREKIIAVVTFVVFLFWLRHVTSDSSRKDKVAALKPEPVKKQAPRKISRRPASEEDAPVPVFDWRSVMDNADFEIEEADTPLTRDPFEKLDYRSVFKSTVLDFSELSLSGIIWEESAPLALINNQILAPGEMISGFKVAEIRKNEVVLIKGTEKFVMRLYSQQAGE